MFKTDKQTISDLHIFPNSKTNLSVMEIFDCVSTYGGQFVLDSMFRKPFSNAEKIANRVELLKYLEQGGCMPKLEREALDFIEHYLNLEKVPSRYSYIEGLRKKIRHKIKPNNEYYIIQRGITYLNEIICDLNNFARSVGSDSQETPKTLVEISQKIISNIEQTELANSLKFVDKKLSALNIEKFDHWLRYLHKDKIRELLDILYEMDVYMSIIKVKTEYGFVYAELSENKDVSIKGLYHPFLEKPVDNDISFDLDSNMCFITGANMAGKSTFMKAFGISVYLAHMGFPVPVRTMTFSPFEGLFTTINVADDITLGYSHFYAEVERIKQVAKDLNSSSKLIVMFDELFRGTNVKDAFEATVEVIKACSANRNSLFVFSSHIIEAAEVLENKIPNMSFKYFGTTLEEEKLSYSYRIYDGISDDRLGMYIINKERVIELLKGSVK